MDLESKISELVSELELIENDKLRVSWFAIGGQFGCVVQSTKYQDGIIAGYDFTYAEIESGDISSLKLEMSTSLKSDTTAEYDKFMFEARNARHYPREKKKKSAAKNHSYNDPDSPMMQQIHDDTQFYGREAAMQMQGLDDRDFEFWD